MSTHMDVLFPKLLTQTLGQRPQPMFSCRKCTRSHIPPNRRHRTRKYQRTPLPGLSIHWTFLECQYRKWLSAGDIGVEKKKL